MEASCKRLLALCWFHQSRGGLPMARKRRGTTTGKRKKSRKTSRKPNRRRGERRSRSVGNKIRSAYRTVVDTIKDTGRLRNKMEPAGTSETE